MMMMMMMMMMLNFQNEDPYILGTDSNVQRRNIYKYYRKKELIQRSNNQSKEIEYIKKVSLHALEHLKCKNMLKDEPELKDLKTVPSHPRYHLSRRLKYAPANIMCNQEFLKEFPYFIKKVRVNETDKIK